MSICEFLRINEMTKLGKGRLYLLGERGAMLPHAYLMHNAQESRRISGGSELHD